jgi:hypothetical protein
MSERPAGRDRPGPPGYDEILVTEPPAAALCSNAEHRRLYVLAEVVVTFGELGVAWQKSALWQMNWHKSFSLCGKCLGNVLEVARGLRPGLRITGTACPSTGSGGPAATEQITP